MLPTTYVCKLLLTQAAHIDRPLDDRSDNEDEKPVIVLPKDSSITEEEIEQG